MAPRCSCPSAGILETLNLLRRQWHTPGARRRQEQVVRHSRTHEVHIAASDAILVTDDQGRITGFNRKYVEMWAIPEG